jgi:hypothetical protein
MQLLVALRLSTLIAYPPARINCKIRRRRRRRRKFMHALICQYDCINLWWWLFRTSDSACMEHYMLCRTEEV